MSKLIDEEMINGELTTFRLVEEADECKYKHLLIRPCNISGGVLCYRPVHDVLDEDTLICGGSPVDCIRGLEHHILEAVELLVESRLRFKEELEREEAFENGFKPFVPRTRIEVSVKRIVG